MADEPRQSGIVIRPMGIGEVLDSGFSLARNNFRLLITIAAWGVIPGQALSAIAALVLASLGEISITASLSLASLLASVLSGFGGTLAAFALQIACRASSSPRSRMCRSDLAAVSSRDRADVSLGDLYAGNRDCRDPAVHRLPLGIYLAVRWSMIFIPFVAQRMGPSPRCVEAGHSPPGLGGTLPACW